MEKQSAPQSEQGNRPKLRKQRLTGLFRRENEYGTYFTGKLEDGQQVIVHEPRERKADGPEWVLSLLVPDTGEQAKG